MFQPVQGKKEKIQIIGIRNQRGDICTDSKHFNRGTHMNNFIPMNSKT